MTKPPKKEHSLTPRHRRVLDLVATGETAAAAWRAVYPRANAVNARCSASRLMARPEAREYLSGVQRESRVGAVLTLTRKRELLEQFAEDFLVEVKDRCKAIELDARLAGEFAAEKHAVDVSELGTILREIRGE